jgi:osmotically-inducible protein OsmY
MDDAPEHLAADIEELLAEDPRVSAQGLDVQVRGEDVTVRGEVATAAQRDGIAVVLAERAPGCRPAVDVRVVGSEVVETPGAELIR